MNKETIKLWGRKILVDGASIAIFLVVVYTFLTGVGSLYKSFYETGRLPTPETFTSASAAFASATSFVYMLLLTRKYRNSGKGEDHN